MYCGYGTCTVIPTCFMLWGVGGLCVYYLGPSMPNFRVWGFYLQGGICYGYDDYLVWGLCAFEPFCRNVGFLWALNYGYAYFVLVGHGL